VSARHATTGRTLEAHNQWLFGRAPDLLLGCGLAYILSIPCLLYMSAGAESARWPVLAISIMALFANSPHYGATLVRVYDARQDRRKYALFSIYTTALLGVLLVASTRSAWLASLLITAYITWSPWHFSGQNYGLTLMFLRRRGADVDLTTKRLIHASFVLSAALAILAIHAGKDDLVFAPNTLAVANAPTVLHLPVSDPVTVFVVPLVVLSYLATLGGAAWRLRRTASPSMLAPAGLLVLTQALWFTVPAVLLDWDHARGSTLVFAAVWVSTAHSLQYLWITAYYERAARSISPIGVFLAKSFAAGTAIVILPGVLLAPHFLGELPWDVGLAATVFAVVNLHHFVLDGAIWKLRDGRVARILLRSSGRPDPSLTTGDSRHGRWLRAAVWTLIAVAVPIQASQIYAQRTLASGVDGESARLSGQILYWLGREGVEANFVAGRRFAANGDRAAAIGHFRRSLELFPTARVHAALGTQYRALGRWDLALREFDQAIALNPEFFGAHHRRAEALLALDPKRTQSDTLQAAISSLSRALEIFPGFGDAALLMAELQSEGGDDESAIETLRRALSNAEGGRSPASRQAIERRLTELERSGSE